MSVAATTQWQHLAIAQKIPKIQEMSLSKNKNVALSARNIFGVASLAGRASSVRFPVSLKFHRAIEAKKYDFHMAPSMWVSIFCCCTNCRRNGPLLRRPFWLNCGWLSSQYELSLVLYPLLSPSFYQTVMLVVPSLAPYDKHIGMAIVLPQFVRVLPKQ